MRLSFFKKYIVFSIIVLVIFLICLAVKKPLDIVQAWILPSQLSELGDPSLVYLPHGVRVLFGTLYGMLSVPALFIAHFPRYANIIGSDFYLVLSLNLINAFTIPFLVLAIYKKNSIPLKNITLKVVIILSISSSVLMSFAKAVVRYAFGAITGFEIDDFFFMYLVGDVLGAILFFKLFIYCNDKFDFLEKFKKYFNLTKKIIY